MMEERLFALMAYCKLDELSPEDEDELTGMYYSAVSYLEDAGVREPAEDTARWHKWFLCIKAMVLDAWDNRGTQTAGYSMVANPAFRQTVNQLKRIKPVSNSDTGTGT